MAGGINTHIPDQSNSFPVPGNLICYFLPVVWVISDCNVLVTPAAERSEFVLVTAPKSTFSTWTGQSIIALIAWKKEEWRKKAADIPPSKVENDLCSTRQILALFRGQPWEDCRETGRSAYGPFRALRCHLQLKLKLKLKPQREVDRWHVYSSTKPPPHTHTHTRTKKNNKQTTTKNKKRKQKQTKKTTPRVTLEAVNVLAMVVLSLSSCLAELVGMYTPQRKKKPTHTHTHAQRKTTNKQQPKNKPKTTTTTTTTTKKQHQE